MTSASDAVVYSALAGYVYSKNASDLPLNIGKFGVTVKIDNSSDDFLEKLTNGQDKKNYGFYAESNQYDGKTVIAFRGTDFDATNRLEDWANANIPLMSPKTLEGDDYEYRQWRIARLSID